MLQEQVKLLRKEATLITADFGGAGVEAYAMAWLKLWNNSREHQDMVYKVFNDNNNGVGVVCKKGKEDIIKDFLTDIIVKFERKENDETVCQRVGKVTGEYPVTVGMAVYECDSDYPISDKRYDDDMVMMIDYMIPVM